MVELYGRSGGEMTVNTTHQGRQVEPLTARLSSGGFVVVWNDSSGLGGDSDGYSVKGQRYDETGAKAGSEFLVNTSTAGTQTATGIATLADGGFVVTFRNAGAIVAQMFDSSGARSGGEIPISPASGFPDYAAVAGLPSGGFIVTWGRGGVHAARFDSAGAPVGEPFQVSTPANGFQYDPSIAILASGGFVIGWQHDVGPAQYLRARVYDANGVAGPVILMEPGHHLQIAALAGGGYAATWWGSDGVKVQIFTDSGTPFTRPFEVNPVGNNGWPSIDALPWGGFVVTWTEYERGGDPLSGVVGQVYQAGGGTLGDRFSVNTVTEGNQTLPAVSVLESGGFVVAWQDGDSSVPDPEVKAQIFQLAADDGDDTVTGDEAANTIDGGNGNDTLYGMGGDDRLNGEAGNDRIDGGAGNDRLTVSGTGADVAVGGSGFDTLVVDYGDSAVRISMTVPNSNPAGGHNGTIGGSARRIDYNGIEAFIVTTGSGNDTLVTGSGNDQLRPGTGTDSVLAGAGDDLILFAGALTSADSIDGGAGIDTLVLQGNYAGSLGLGTNVVGIENITILGGNDTSLGEPGTNRYDYVLRSSDSNFAAGVQARIDGSALLQGEDLAFDGSAETNASFVLTGGRGADLLQGGAQADLIQGNFGADRLFGGGGADTFRYLAVTESYSVAKDHILDFTPGADKIDLAAIDASRAVGGDQAFTWIGSSAFSKVAGQLRAFQQGSDWVVEGDINGDGFADLIIAVTVQGQTPLGPGDFLL